MKGREASVEQARSAIGEGTVRSRPWADVVREGYLWRGNVSSEWMVAEPLSGNGPRID